MSPLNRVDYASKSHDKGEITTWGWIGTSYSPNTPGISPGPIGWAYAVVGTIGFGIGGFFD